MSKYVSTDNGNSFQKAEDVNIDRYWEELLNVMDREIMKKVNEELAPCSKREFLERYLELAEYDIVIG